MDFEGLTPQEAAEAIQYDPLYSKEGVVNNIADACQHFSNRGLMQARGGLRSVLESQMEWSSRTFGEGRRTIGIAKHIEKEIAEIRDNPTDLIEWIDVILLALDGYWRHGGTPETIMRDLLAKQAKNRTRLYPMTGQDEPSEHIR